MQTTHRVRSPWRRFGGIAALACALTLLAAAYARGHVSFWGLPYVYPTDEPTTVARAIHMLQRETLDPGFFRYGSLLTYTCMAIDQVVVWALQALDSTSPAHIADLSGVVPGGADGYQRPPSHPELYLAPRLVMAVIGTATVALSGLVVFRATGHAWAALAACAFLATNAFHIKMSSEVQNDTMIAFFAIGAALLAQRAHKGLGLAPLLASAAFAGAAGSCKVTGFSAIAAPLLVALGASDTPLRMRLGRAAALVGVSTVVFALCNPAAVLQPARLLRDLSAEADHYLLRGHAEHTVAPGLPYLGKQAGDFVLYAGWPASVVAALGLLAMLGHRRGRLLLAIPALHLAGMSLSRVDFHRNMLAVYPFAAVAVGFAISTMERRWTRSAVTSALGPAVVLVYSLVLASRTLPYASSASDPEPRTAAVLRAASLADEGRLGLPSELRFHPRDVALADNVRVASIPSLLCDESITQVLLPGDVTASRTPEWSAWLRGWLPFQPTGRPFELEGPAWMYTVIPVANQAAGEQCEGLLAPEELVLPAGWEVYQGGIAAFQGGSLALALPDDDHAYVLSGWVRGTPAGGAWPLLQLTHAEGGGSFEASAEWTELRFEAIPGEAGARAVTLSFVNDAVVGSEDRNVYLRELRLRRADGTR